MTLTAIISLVLLTATVVLSAIWAMKKFGYLSSISQAFYELIAYFGEAKAIYFSAWCSLVALLAYVPLHEITQGKLWNVLTLPLCLGILVVGVVPRYRDPKYKYWHFIATGISALCAAAITILEGYWILLAIVFAACLFMNFRTKEKDHLLWLECTFIVSAILLMWIKIW